MGDTRYQADWDTNRDPRDRGYNRFRDERYRNTYRDNSYRDDRYRDDRYWDDRYRDDRYRDDGYIDRERRYRYDNGRVQRGRDR